MSPYKPTGRPPRRPPGRAQPQHRLTQLWQEQIHQDRHAVHLLRIAIHVLKKNANPPQQKGSDHDDQEDDQ